MAVGSTLTRLMEDLTPRKESILRAVVIEYVETAEPVGSGLLVERYSLGVGPATVRHELAEMSERGLLEQPHTSAGRIPSDSGYRYYVDRMPVGDMSIDTENQMRKVVSEEASLDELLSETCRLLARMTQYVSVAATVRERSVFVRQVSISNVTQQRALLVVVFSNGAVEDKIIEATPDLTLEDLHRVSEAITKGCEGLRLSAIARKPQLQYDSLKPSAQALLHRGWKAVRSIAKSMAAGKVITEGTSYLLGQPEFQKDFGALSGIVQALEDSAAIQGALDRPGDSNTSVTIGKENETAKLQHLAVIASRFFVNNEEAGSLAIIGPTRMKYEQTIPLVEQTARALSDALTKLLR